jgi:hypothetical protein
MHTLFHKTSGASCAGRAEKSSWPSLLHASSQRCVMAVTVGGPHLTKIAANWPGNGRQSCQFLVSFMGDSGRSFLIGFGFQRGELAIRSDEGASGVPRRVSCGRRFAILAQVTGTCFARATVTRSPSRRMGGKPWRPSRIFARISLSLIGCCRICQARSLKAKRKFFPRLSDFSCFQKVTFHYSVRSARIGSIVAARQDGTTRGSDGYEQQNHWRLAA